MKKNKPSVKNRKDIGLKAWMGVLIIFLLDKAPVQSEMNLIINKTNPANSDVFEWTKSSQLKTAGKMVVAGVEALK